jgi:hypothetical protein
MSSTERRRPLVSVVTLALSVKNFELVPAGTAHSNPGQLICSPKARDLFQQLRQRYEFIVVDSVPVLPFAEGRALAPFSRCPDICWPSRADHAGSNAPQLANVARGSCRTGGGVCDERCRYAVRRLQLLSRLRIPRPVKYAATTNEDTNGF